MPTGLAASWRRWSAPSAADPARRAGGSAIDAVLEGRVIPGLDALRGASVLLVIFSHYGFGRLVPGGLGVTVFFFVSGFLITTLLLREKAETGGIAVRRFYVRRLLRLAPEMLLMLVATSVLGLLYFQPFPPKLGFPSPGDWAAALTYTTNYYHLVALEGTPVARWPHLWSLAVEEHYYLTYPLLVAALVARRSRYAAAVAGVCLAALAWRSVVPSLGLPAHWIHEASDCRIDSIAYGCLTALLFRWRPEFLRRSGDLPGALLAVGVALLVLSLAVRGGVFREGVRYTVQGLGLAGIFVGLYAWRRSGPLLRTLEAPPLRWMGRLSYGAYLWHFEFVMIFAPTFGMTMDDLPIVPRFVVAVGATAAVFATAWLSFQVANRPFVGLRRRYGSHATNA